MVVKGLVGSGGLCGHTEHHEVGDGRCESVGFLLTEPQGVDASPPGDGRCDPSLERCGPGPEVTVDGAAAYTVYLGQFPDLPAFAPPAPQLGDLLLVEHAPRSHVPVHDAALVRSARARSRARRCARMAPCASGLSAAYAARRWAQMMSRRA